MARKYRRHSAEFKREAVERLKNCDSVKGLAKELGVNRRLLYCWKEELGPSPKERQAAGNEAAVIGRLKQEVTRLKTALGEKALEIDFFKGALQRVEARRQSNNRTGAPGSTTKSGR